MGGIRIRELFPAASPSPSLLKSGLCEQRIVEAGSSRCDGFSLAHRGLQWHVELRPSRLESLFPLLFSVSLQTTSEFLSKQANGVEMQIGFYQRRNNGVMLQRVFCHKWVFRVFLLLFLFGLLIGSWRRGGGGVGGNEGWGGGL